MDVKSANESSFLTKQVQKYVESLKSSELYLFSTDIRYVGVIITGSTRNINSLTLRTT